MEVLVLCMLTGVFLLWALSDLRNQAVALPGHMPWGYTMGWARGAALPGPPAELYLGDVSSGGRWSPYLCSHVAGKPPTVGKRCLSFQKVEDTRQGDEINGLGRSFV